MRVTLTQAQMELLFRIVEHHHLDGNDSDIEAVAELHELLNNKEISTITVDEEDDEDAAPQGWESVGTDHDDEAQIEAENQLEDELRYSGLCGERDPGDFSANELLETGAKLLGETHKDVVRLKSFLAK